MIGAAEAAGEDQIIPTKDRDKHRAPEAEAPAAPYCPLRRLAAGMLLGAGTGFILAHPVHAQSREGDEAADSELEEVIVTDQQRESYRVEQSSMSKLTEALRDTPQSITTVSRELIEDRGALSLNDALRDVPGITLGAGEFSWQGNNPSIRGFSSRNDMFLDGMRDFGSYYRDPFDLETIEVLEGPSSTIFGRGSTGGAINQVSKRPTLEPETRLAFNGGSDSTARATVDLDRPLAGFGNGAAVRLNVMAHHARVAGRDVAETQRYGLAPSLALGLGTPTRLTLSYFKQTADDVPDYGLPWFDGRPASVPRQNFYGFDSDYVKTDTDVLTAELEHDAGGRIDLHAQMRYADYTRESRLTEPLIAASVPVTTPLSDITVERNVFKGESEETMFQTQVDVTARFATGLLRHTLVSGLEAGKETSAPTFGFGTGVPGTNLLAPSEDERFSATGTAPRLKADTVGDSAAFYALDTMKLGESWEVVAGLRWDRFDANYEATRFAVDGSVTGTEAIERVDTEWSPRAAIVYKPAEAGSIYLSWGTSFNPSAEGLSFITSGRGLGLGNATLAPEENESTELGLKWDLLDERLSFTSAAFRITKLNARVPDPDNPGFNRLDGKQRVDGLSVSLVGRLGERLQTTAGYTYLDGKIVESAPGAAPVGSPLTHAPKRSLSLWASYRISDRLEAGAGARYVGKRLAQNVPPVKEVPDYWAFDAMLRYTVSDTVTVKVNLTNLTDEYYFDQLHPWHVVPGPGRTAVVAVDLAY